MIRVRVGGDRTKQSFDFAGLNSERCPYTINAEEEEEEEEEEDPSTAKEASLSAMAMAMVCIARKIRA
jgi:hypothetical protein